MCPLFIDQYDKINPEVKNIIEMEFLSGYKEMSFYQFWEKLYYRINVEQGLTLYHCKAFSKMTVFHDELIGTSDFDKGIIISPNMRNIIYDSITKEYSKEIENDLKTFFGEKILIMKAHILSAILSLNPENKHIALFYGSSSSGKSTRAKIASFIVDGFYKASSLENVSKTMGDILSQKLPIIDNIDSSKSISNNSSVFDNIAKQISSSRGQEDERYSIRGFDAFYNSYYQMTTTNPRIFDRPEYMAIKSRCIYIDCNDSEEGALRFRQLIKEKNEWIKRAQAHFYYLAEEYLKSRKNLKFPKEVYSLRITNFTEALYYLDQDYALEIIKSYNQNMTENISFVTDCLLDMIEEDKLYKVEIPMREWVERLKTYMMSRKKGILEAEGIEGSENEVKSQLSKLLNVRYFYERYIVRSSVKDIIGNIRFTKLPPSGRNKVVKMIAIKVN